MLRGPSGFRLSMAWDSTARTARAGLRDGGSGCGKKPGNVLDLAGLLQAEMAFRHREFGQARQAVQRELTTEDRGQTGHC